jgi:biotin-dependent carboxylase-like uncharacterized protein
VPVQYGGEAGPDLQDVANMHGLSPEEVIRLHTGRTYRVHFLGFLPGFAYLGKLHPNITTSRLAIPRTRVAAGSVGLAGGQTAVYPFASPGGWRIIGRTSLPVWDPFSDTPIRFAAGDTVRFAPSAYQPAVDEHRPAPITTSRPVLEVLDTVGLTTVQDLGRPGLAHLGVARGGVFDAPAAMRANSLVGNPPDAAVLELTWQGPTFRVLRTVTIALSGADLGCRVGNVLIPSDLSWFVRRGSILRFSPTGRSGVRGYLALAGGIDVPVILGSRSTSLQAHFGGFGGRPLETGDIIGVGEDAADSGLLAGKYWPGKTRPMPHGQVTIRFLRYQGRGAARLALPAFQAETFELTDHSDRMGSRFRSVGGVPLPTSSRELISFGVVRGAIQLPPSGNPVVLNVEHQTTGGYPLLGVVAKVDLPLLAQLPPGTAVRFIAITREEACEAQHKVSRELAEGLRRLGQVPPAGQT